MNLLVRVKLVFTPNFTALGHLEVPEKFVVGGGGCRGYVVKVAEAMWWCKPTLVFIFRPLVELNNIPYIRVMVLLHDT